MEGSKIVDIDLTWVEKEVIREFISKSRENTPLALIGPAELAKRMEFSRPRAHAILTKLEEKKFLEKMDRKGFYLTNKGAHLINELQHRSMVMETYFVEKLGMSIKSAENESQNIVLHVSQDYIDILCNLMGKPSTCPHNYPIPH